MNELENRSYVTLSFSEEEEIRPGRSLTVVRFALMQGQLETNQEPLPAIRLYPRDILRLHEWLLNRPDIELDLRGVSVTSVSTHSDDVQLTYADNLVVYLHPQDVDQILPTLVYLRNILVD